MSRTLVPELLAPAGTLDAVRAAVANGANAVYLGASMYNARDEGAQLSLDELALACAIAHARGARVYLTFNVLIKPEELTEALASILQRHGASCAMELLPESERQSMALPKYARVNTFKSSVDEVVQTLAAAGWQDTGY